MPPLWLWAFSCETACALPNGSGTSSLILPASLHPFGGTVKNSEYISGDNAGSWLIVIILHCCCFLAIKIKERQWSCQDWRWWVTSWDYVVDPAVSGLFLETCPHSQWPGATYNAVAGTCPLWCLPRARRNFGSLLAYCPVLTMTASKKMFLKWGTSCCERKGSKPRHLSQWSFFLLDIDSPWFISGVNCPGKKEVGIHIRLPGSIHCPWNKPNVLDYIILEENWNVFKVASAIKDFQNTFSGALVLGRY